MTLAIRTLKCTKSNINNKYSMSGLYLKIPKFLLLSKTDKVTHKGNEDSNNR
jgi:hypothetical protein